MSDDLKKLKKSPKHIKVETEYDKQRKLSFLNNPCIEDENGHVRYVAFIKEDGTVLQTYEEYMSKQ